MPFPYCSTSENAVQESLLKETEYPYYYYGETTLLFTYAISNQSQRERDREAEGWGWDLLNKQYLHCVVCTVKYKANDNE